MTFFSIIVPTHNRSKLLKKCINSVLSQEVQDWELLVVDNASTDDTKTVVAGFNDPRIKYFFQEKADRSLARNKGIEEAIGDYILFIDDDDYILKNHLTTFLKAISKKEDPSTIYRVGFLIEKDSTRTPSRNYFKKRDKNPVRFAAFNMCSACSLCIPKYVLKENKFPVGYPLWEDTHLILRLFAHYPMKQILSYTYIYVQHQTMGSEHIFSNNLSKERIKLNIKAINDLFGKYGNELSSFLPDDTEEQLIAEKYLHYAIGDIVHGNLKYYKEFIKSSLSLAIRFRFWKYYLVIVKNLLLKKLSLTRSEKKS